MGKVRGVSNIHNIMIYTLYARIIIVIIIVYRRHNTLEFPWRLPGLGLTVRRFWDNFFECALRRPGELFTTYQFYSHQTVNDAQLGLRHLREYLLRLEYPLPLNNAKDIFVELELNDPEMEPEFVQPEQESEES